MDSRQQFFDVINDYYSNIVGDNLPPDLLIELCNKITDYYYNQYTRFGKQYPKSIKRYSTIQLKDLDHPDTKELIINYFKMKIGVNYAKYSKLVLNMTSEELAKFEKYREDFHNMW